MYINFKTFGLILALIISTSLFAQNEYTYISPVPGSKFINPKNQITLRVGEKIDKTSLHDNLIELKGSKSGIIAAKASLSKDGNTLIFHPAKEFALDEKVEVKISYGIKSISGKEFPELQFVFFTKPIENEQMLIDFYQWKEDQVNSFSKVKPMVNSQKESVTNLITYGDYQIPDDFPEPSVSVLEDPYPGYTFVTPRPRGTAPFSQYNLIMDKYGVPLFYREWPVRSNLFQAIPNDQLMYCDFTTSDPSYNKWLVLDNHYNTLDTLLMGNGYHVDQHGGYMYENGNHLLMAYDPQLVGMDTVVPGGDPNATVVGLIIQELDADHNVLFQWRSWDHFEITDVNDKDLTAPYIDYAHGNSVYPTPDGNIIISCRAMDEITKIDRNTGEIIWRFGMHAQNNMFTINNDTSGFSKQHDAILHEDGHLTVYDNGVKHEPQFSQSMRYIMDEENLVADLIWNYIDDPVIYAYATGGAKRFPNENNLICWGLNWPVSYTEVKEDGSKVWEVVYPDSVWQYQAFRSHWKTDLFVSAYDTIDYGYHDDYIPWPRVFNLFNNTDEDIIIQSASNHLEEFYLSTELPATIPANGELTMIVYFYPQTVDDFEDVLTLNHDGYYADTLSQRVSVQIVLKGTTIEPTSVNEFDKIAIRVYPNPVSEKIFVEGDVQEIRSFKLYSMESKILRQEDKLSTNTFEIDVRELQPGMYFLELETGNQKVLRKIIKN